MDSDSKLKNSLSAFAKFAWFVLIYNLVVIIWGVFLRASLSGDGCGQHWLTCHGEVVPSAPQLKTVIEFTHRLMSGIAFFVVLALAIWAFRKFVKGDILRKTALASFLLIVVEALLGAGLVLTGNTANAITPTRPFWTAAHLISTFILLSALSLTAWLASGGKTFTFQAPRKILLLLAIGVLAILLIGTSGSIAALSGMLYPVHSLAEGLGQDFSADSPLLLRLRISHPILSVLGGFFLVFLAYRLKSISDGDFWINRWANVLVILVGIQFASGILTLLTLAPIFLQLIHLLLADLTWIAFVLLSASTLAKFSENFNYSTIDNKRFGLKNSLAK